MPGGRQFLFTAHDTAGALGIYAQDFDPTRDTTASRRPLLPFDPDLAIESFGISPDGRTVIVSRSEATQSLILAEGVPGVRPPIRAQR